MSTKKTEHCQLHAWEPEDDFLLREINENFAALDGGLGKKAEMIFGAYQGDDGGERLISLGATPRVVLVVSGYGVMGVNGVCYGGLALEGYPVKNSNQNMVGEVVTIVEGGFQVRQGSAGVYGNSKSHFYHYLALV